MLYISVNENGDIEELMEIDLEVVHNLVRSDNEATKMSGTLSTEQHRRMGSCSG
jgi:hypothetical protein